MKINALVYNTCDLQIIEILSHFDKVLYRGLAKDLPPKFKPMIYDFFTAENNTLTIYLH